MGAEGLSRRTTLPAPARLPLRHKGRQAQHVAAPVYSHLVYDIVPGEAVAVDRPDILIVEGLNVLQTSRLPRDGRGAPVRLRLLRLRDLPRRRRHRHPPLVHRALHAPPPDRLPRPGLLFHRYSAISEAEAAALAEGLWSRINLLNLRENILPTRPRADLIIRKAADHRVARTVDALEHVHFYQRSVVCRDLTDPFEMDFNTCYASVAGTAKHVGTSWGDPAHMQASLEMLHLIAGSEAKWRARPFVSQSNCFVVPPLRFAQESCRCLEVAVKAGMPVFLVSAGQAGATSPAAIAGSLVQEIAECLAGLVYVNAVKTGAPAIFGPFCFVSDLRTGAMSGGSPEQALLSASAAQMAQFYDLTCGTPSGMTNSKMPDVQAGYEKAYNHALVGNAGANLCYESAGMMASLLGFSLEQLVIDNDIIGATQRTIRGIEVTDEALSVETIRAICLGGPNHFLGNEQTLARMQRDYLYPAVGDRTSPKEWVEQGRPTALDKAEAKLKTILTSHHPDHIPPHIDQAIRERFPVRLPRAAMRSA